MTGEAPLLQAEERARAARSLEALAFAIANETWQLRRYRQALVWRERASGGPELLAVSGLATLPEDSPFTVWLRGFVRLLRARLGAEPQVFDLAAADLADGWQEWWPRHLVAVPLVRDGERLGFALFLLEEQPGEAQLALFARLQSVWSHSAWALSRPRGGWSLKPAGGKLRWVLLAAALAALCFPVHQTALAPAEIVALKAIAVSAPIDGVVKSFHVQPNQPVKAGQPLFSLDDTTLRNRREVAARGLDVAASELLSAQQKAFDDLKARADVATLQGRIAERSAELRAVDEQFKRVDVSAPRDGIAVFGDTNDWQGRPVTTGERVMQLADPKDAGVLVFLPVADAIALNEGGRIRLFLHVAPLSPIEAMLAETSYLAVQSPDGIASYRLRARIEQAEAGTARIGLKGTAKIYGERVPLAYYLLRRPLAALRQWSGF